MAIKVYGTNLCPETLHALSVFTANHYMPDFVNITGSIQLLKEFNLLRDTLEIYEGVRSRHSVGVPLFQLEDGTYTLDAKKAFASVGIDAELSYKN